MNRAKQLLLLATVVAVQAMATPVQARAACHAIAVQSPGQTILLRNGSDRSRSLSLRFEGVDQAPRACGQLTIAAGGDSGPRTLASLCPAATAAIGTLEACSAPVVIRARRGAASGDLLADMQDHNIPLAGH